jgi:hypothetical protein
MKSECGSHGEGSDELDIVVFRNEIFFCHIIHTDYTN